MDTATLQTFSKLAQDYGPFFFAVLFTVFVTAAAHGRYREANLRTTPAASAEERRTYRTQFILTSLFSIMLTLISIGWFIFNQLYVISFYQISIISLQPNQYIDTQDYYTKTVQRTIAGIGTQVRDLYILVPRQGSFEIGDRFNLAYFETNPDTGLGAAPTGLFEIVYDGNPADSFRIDGPNGARKLVRQSDRSGAPGRIALAGGTR